MKEWSFLTNHARALVCIAHDPGAACATSPPRWGSPSAAPTPSSPTWPRPATWSRTKTLTAVVTATRSRTTSRYQRPLGENGQLGRSWTCSSTALANQPGHDDRVVPDRRAPQLRGRPYSRPVKKLGVRNERYPFGGRRTRCGQAYTVVTGPWRAGQDLRRVLWTVQRGRARPASQGRFQGRPSDTSPKWRG